MTCGCDSLPPPVTGTYQEGVFYKAIFSKYRLTPPTTYSQFITELNSLKSHSPASSPARE